MRTLVALFLAICIFTASAETPKVAILHVDNMTCPACGITIERALAKVPGTSKPRINARSAIVTVKFDAERTNAAAIARAITNAGFPAKVKANGD
jgi:mercuric ion binding protein